MKREFSNLKTRVSFYEFAPKVGPEPGESEIRILHECWAGVETVWLKDLEQAKSNGTTEDLTIFIRDTRGEFIPHNNQYIGINDEAYKGKRYNIKAVQPDLQDKRFLTIVAGLES
jgi:hypothetical protein